VILLNIHTAPNNLQIQCNCYQSINDIFQRSRKNNSTIHMEPQKGLNSEGYDLEQKYQNRWCQKYLISKQTTRLS
jgi:hypothetical protein